jgi:hypothetical protein
VVSQELGYPLDPHLTLLDAEGKVLDENDDSGRQNRDVQLTITAPADGQYRAVVRDLHRHGGPRYFYRLTMRRAEPDFSLRLAADSFVLASGKPLEIPVAIDRQNGFDEEIEISVSGLPENVIAKPVQSAGKGGTAKSVKIVLESEAAEPFSGPIRALGKSSGEKKLTRTATAPLAGLNTAVEDVWLTVGAKK